MLDDEVKGECFVRAPELSIIVPVFNERANIAPLVGLVADALPDVAWELIFVDDNSPDAVSYTHLTLPTKA
mgnify:CR=1 FL=1